MHKLESRSSRSASPAPASRSRSTAATPPSTSSKASSIGSRPRYEETQNARRVLEQTVADRLPRVEERLTEAKKLLFTRDREIGELTRTAERQSRALAEAAAINAQQQAEIERLRRRSPTRAARSQDGTSDPRFDGEVALRSEIEALRAKTREQAQLLVRMQSLAGRPGGLKSIDGGGAGAGAGAGSVSPDSNGATGTEATKGETAAHSGALQQADFYCQLRPLNKNRDS